MSEQVNSYNLVLRRCDTAEIISTIWEEALTKSKIEVKVKAGFRPGQWKVILYKTDGWTTCADLGTGVCVLWKPECLNSELETLKGAIRNLGGWISIATQNGEHCSAPIGNTEAMWLRRFKAIVDPGGILNCDLLEVT